MAEGLSRSIIVALHANKLSGLQLHASAPPSMHEKFMDDTLLMGLLTIREASALNTILSNFFAASGTTIDPEKSNLFFFNTPLPIHKNISRLLDFPIITLPSNYLGVPLTDRPLSQATWEGLINKVEKLISNWTFISLNLASHLVLVKSVLQAIPLYLYLALVSPKVISNKIRNLQRNLLWRGVKEKRKWALVAWEKISSQKRTTTLVSETQTFSGRPWEPKLYGDGLKTLTPLGESFGKLSVPLPSRRKKISGLMAASKDHLFGIKHGRIGQSFKNIVSRRFEIETRLSSRRILGNRALNLIKIKTNKSRLT